jgi:hypothetical protein
MAVLLAGVPIAVIALASMAFEGGLKNAVAFGEPTRTTARPGISNLSRRHGCPDAAAGFGISDPNGLLGFSGGK